MNSNKTASRIEPIILCHAACTGGSLIYRLLVLSFQFIGISEISHVCHLPSNPYLPLDPEAQLYLQNFIDSTQFADIFFNRICRCEEIVRTSGRTLLIREHSHSYFFNPASINNMDNISWINSRYQRLYGKSLLCLLSVRDPIDSWLGLLHNFPKEKPIDFDTYCERYLNFLDMSGKTKNIYLFKYEEITQDPKNTLLKISKEIGYDLYDIDIEKNNNIASSGNSGRQGSRIAPRPRRPFTTHLVNSAKNSRNYEELCNRLGYIHLSETINFKEKIKILKNNLNNILYNIDIRLEKTSRKFSLVRD